ncbi:hypothetical protein J2Y54_002296 [Sphingomonas sp. BE123]|jgi:hypothetical protein|uniref:hypothetical protein n=1 Tax=unclassified Sphingomonas TaxID=196159 RepID=UPI002858F0CD|nr:hypothetical protein [Sphingomonas sp. BE123]MDR6852776.1 hypothetical protein [Sphingomonas sp. BE123]
MSIALLIAAAFQATTPAPSTAAPDPNEKLCKRIDVTGSLARKERVCKTRAEWTRLADAGNSVARAIVEHGTGRPAGGP